MVCSIVEASGTPIAATTTYQYDSRANVSTATDSAGRVTRFFYDKLDRLTAVILPDPDGTGGLISRMLRYDYDVFGNLIATEVINSSIDSTGQRIVTSLVDGFTYDNSHRLTGEYEQDPDKVWYVTGITGSGVTRITTSSVASQVDMVALAQSNPRITTSDVAGSTTTPATDQASQGAVTLYAYDLNGNVISTEVSDANSGTRKTTLTYDAIDRPIKVVTPAPGALAAQNVPGEIRNSDPAAGEIGGYVFTSFFDNIGQQWRSTNTLGVSSNYRYDRIGRMISESAPDPSGGTITNVITYASTPSVVTEPQLLRVKEPEPLRLSLVNLDCLGKWRFLGLDQLL